MDDGLQGRPGSSRIGKGGFTFMRPVAAIAAVFGIALGAVAQQVSPSAAPPNQPDNMQEATAPTLPILKVFQFPSDQIPRVDGKDDDWSVVPDSYALTLSAMHDDEKKHSQPDPKVLEIKVKVAWVKGLYRLYFL